MNVGKTILSIRKEKQMSQEEFGELFHVTRQTVSNWENEKTYYQIDRNGELLKQPDGKWAFTTPTAEVEAICKEHVEELKEIIKTGDEIYKSVYQQ